METDSCEPRRGRELLWETEHLGPVVAVASLEDWGRRQDSSENPTSSLPATGSGPLTHASPFSL